MSAFREIFMNEENYNDTDWGGPCGHDGGGCAGPDDILSCIPMPCGCCRFLRKLRAPAVRLRWSIDKQTIPDLDAERAGRQDTGSADDAAQTGQTDADRDCTCGDDCACGASGGTSTMRGSMTVRLFDMALAGGAMLLLCGMSSCCRKLCRKMF